MRARLLIKIYQERRPGNGCAVVEAENEGWEPEFVFGIGEWLESQDLELITYNEL